MTISAHQFYLKWNGKKCDTDNYPPEQPYQCVDLAKEFFIENGANFNYYCGHCGYAEDFWLQRQTSGALNYCTPITNKAALQDGDVVVWGKGGETPYSHIGIFRKYDGSTNRAIILGQNQGGHAYVDQQSISLSSFLGALRIKALNGNTSNTGATSSKPDQILTVGSKVKSIGMIAEKIDIKKDMVYNSVAGGWIPCADVDEVDARDGKKDQILHVGSGFAFPKEMTVGKVNAKQNTAYIVELGYWLRAECLTETKEGN